MRVPIFIPIIAVCISGWMLPGCVSGDVKSKKEFVEWYSGISELPGFGKVGYRGSDAQYHHFVVRPVDSFVFFRVRRSDVKIQDEREEGTAGSSIYFYLVDPLKDFQKVPK
jgi:hypothetical protein